MSLWRNNGALAHDSTQHDYLYPFINTGSHRVVSYISRPSPCYRISECHYGGTQEHFHTKKYNFHSTIIGPYISSILVLRLSLVTSPDFIPVIKPQYHYAVTLELLYTPKASLHSTVICPCLPISNTSFRGVVNYSSRLPPCYQTSEYHYGRTSGRLYTHESSPSVPPPPLPHSPPSCVSSPSTLLGERWVSSGCHVA